MDGPNWNHPSGWLSNASFCLWEGVRCLNGSEPRVVQNLVLLGQSPRGAIPASFNFASIEELDMTNGLITSFPRDFLLNSTRLRWLALVNMSLTTLPASICSSPALENLNLAGNPDIVLPRCANLSRLDSFVCYECQLREIDLGTDLPHLTALLLDHNLLSSIPHIVSSLPTLRTLTFSNNPIGASLVVLPPLPELARLELQGCGLDDVFWSPAFRAGELTPALTFLNLMNNSLTTMPQLDLPLLSQLQLSHNRIAAMPNLTFPLLTQLLLDNNAIEALNTTWLTSSKFSLDVSFNPVAHVTAAFRVPSLTILVLLPTVAPLLTFKATGEGLPLLSGLRLAGNRLEALDLSSFEHLRDMDVSRNRLAKLVLRAGGPLRNIMASENLLPRPPRDMSSLRELNNIDLSHNLIECGGLDLWLSAAGSLYQVRLRSNRIASDDACGLFSYQGPLTSGNPFLLSVDLAHNLITRLSMPRSFPRLDTLDVSHNPLLTSIYDPISPSDPEFPLIRIVDLSHASPELRLGSTWYGQWNASSSDFITYEDLRMDCAGVSTTVEGLQYSVQAEPSAFAYGFCTCFEGLRWNGTGCSSCPEQVACPREVANNRSAAVRYGYFPVLRGERTARLADLFGSYLAKCFDPSLCNPHAAQARPQPQPSGMWFECAAGHNDTSLLCSRCLPGYFALGTKCLECSTAFEWLPLVLAAVLFVGFLALLWSNHSEQEAGKHTTGTLSIVISWAQVTAFVLHEGFLREQGPEDANPMVGFSQLLAFTPFAAECVSSSAGFESVFWATMAAPVAIVVVVLLSACLVRVCCAGRRRAGPRGGLEASEYWLSKVLFMSGFVLRALLITIAQRAFQLFNCFGYDNEGDSSAQLAGVDNLLAAPWLRCDDSEVKAMRVVAGFAIAVYVVGIPLIFGLLTLSHSVSIRTGRFGTDTDRAARLRFGFLWTQYRRDCFYWDLFIAVRKICIVAFLSLLPRNSPFITVGVFLVLLLSLSLQIGLAPFQRAFDNRLELALLFLSTLTYFAGATLLTTGTAAAPGNADSSSHALAQTFIWLNAGVGAVLVVAMVWRMLLARRWCKSARGGKTLNSGAGRDGGDDDGGGEDDGEDGGRRIGHGVPREASLDDADLDARLVVRRD